VEASIHSPGAGQRVYEAMIAAEAINHKSGVGMTVVSRTCVACPALSLGHLADLRSATCTAGPRRYRRWCVP